MTEVQDRFTRDYYNTNDLVLPEAPYTSVQRCITNLTDDGFLVKTTGMVCNRCGEPLVIGHLCAGSGDAQSATSKDLRAYEGGLVSVFGPGGLVEQMGDNGFDFSLEYLIVDKTWYSCFFIKGQYDYIEHHEVADMNVGAAVCLSAVKAMEGRGQ
jgi:hypothetical protein